MASSISTDVNVTNKLNFYTFALKIISPYSNIDLPIKMNNVNKMRIKSLSYITASTGNIFMTISIGGWDDNSVYFDGNNVIPYTKFLLLPPSIGIPVLFDNPYNTSFDVIKSNIVSSINSFYISCRINNSNTISNDISPSNPLYLEIYLEGSIPDIKPIEPNQ